MYIRWNKRKRHKAGWRKKEGLYLSAVLVESHRVAGSPRQKVIKCLGSIGEEKLIHVFPRQRFWATAEKNLDSLGLSTEDRDKIVASIEKVVRKISEDEIASEMDHFKELQERIGRARG